MKKATWLVCLTAVALVFALAPMARAARDDDDRDEQKSRHHRDGDRQEQFEQQHRQMPMPQTQQMQQMAQRMAQMRQMTPPMPPQMPGQPPNMPGASCACASRMPSRCAHCVLHAIVLVLAIVHIILAVWVYGDVQKRGVPGRGVFIVLVLLAGIPMSILYALVRIGDKVGEKTP